MKIRLILFILITSPLLSNAQLSRSDSKAASKVYELTDPMMRDDWKNAQGEYADASAVILELARYDIFDGKMGGVKHTTILRYLLKVNDKSALERFSTINLGQQFGPEIKVRSSRDDFVQLIKANGDVEVVDVSSLERNANSEIAIPGLEVGDVIDYALRTEYLAAEFCTDDILVRLNKDFPVIHGMHRVETESDFFLNFRWFQEGKAPIQKNETLSTRGTAYFDLEYENVAPLPSEYWAPRLLNSDSYHLKICTRNVTRTRPANIIEIPSSGKVKTEVTKDEMEAAMKMDMRVSMLPMKADANIALFKTWMKKNYRGQKPTPEQVMEGAYNFVRYYILIFNSTYNKYRDDYELRYIKEGYFTQFMYMAALNNKVVGEFVYAPSRYRGSIDEVVSMDEFHKFFRFRDSAGNWQYLYAPNSFDTYGRSSEYYEGQAAISLHKKKVTHIDEVPSSTHLENIFRASFSINPDFDERLVQVDMKSSLTGIFKHDLSRTVLRNTGFHEDVERNMLPDGRDDALMENAKLARGRAKSADLVQTDEDEKLLSMKKLRENSFDIKDYQSFRLLHSGVANNLDSLVYMEQFRVQNALSKAGNNYIIDLSKVAIEQMALSDKDIESRERDIMIDFAKTYRYTYHIDIPAGYTLEGADGLNETKENEFGKISINTSAQADKLVIVVEKQYRKPNAKASDWSKFVEFLLPAMKMNNTQLVYKKVS